MAGYKWSIFKVQRRRRLSGQQMPTCDDVDRVIARSESHAISLVMRSRRALGEEPKIQVLVSTAAEPVEAVVSMAGDLLEYEYTVARATGHDARS